MSLRNFFSVSRYAPATQRSTIWPSGQRLTFPVRFLTPDRNQKSNYQRGLRPDDKWISNKNTDAAILFSNYPS